MPHSVLLQLQGASLNAKPAHNQGFDRQADTQKHNIFGGKPTFEKTAKNPPKNPCQTQSNISFLLC